MKILEVMPGLPKGTGTTEFFVESVRAMIAQGVEVSILCADMCGNVIDGAKVFASVKDLPQEYMPDVVHIHALWSPFLAKAHWWAKRRGIAVVITPHGAMSPWAIKSKWWKKSLYWHLIEKPCLKRVKAFHVTAEHEGEWVRDLGFMQRQFIAPLGVRMPVGEGVENKCRCRTEGKTIITVGRIYEVKGLDRIARAIKILKDSGKWNGWKMVMAGPNWMDYQPKLEALIDVLGLKEDIVLPGAVYGEEKERLFRSAAFYIVASHTENFCQPVAEALSYGIPAIASKGTPWQGLESQNCGMWVDNSPESLAKAMAAMMRKSDDERHEMGKRGHEWIEKDFSWRSVGEKMIDGFKKALGVIND